MEIAKLSSKFQVTLPKKVREDLKAKKGDRILFVKRGESWEVFRLPSDPVEALKCLGKKAKLKGTAKEVHEEMEAWER
ncbi:MAG: AbrB/MazE/SpoVT family DNA-binding domain-containing protein [Candidatus Freyarchaeota archaeon]|nr:AbrB/MazE/SpoVT family DNA-binding domain-containing protein [Candidatus Freyarchaeota archaeon]